MITIPIFILILFVFWILNSNIFRKQINYSNIFLAIWCILPVISMFGAYGFYVPPTETYFFILIGVVVFELGTLFFMRIKITSTETRKLQNKKGINWRIMLLIAIICMLVMLPFLEISLKYALRNGYYSLRSRILRNELISTRGKLILQDIIQPLILITTMASIYEMVEGKKLRTVTFISIINCIFYMLIFANRFLTMQVLCFIAIVLVEKYSMNLYTIIIKNKWMVLIGATLVACIVFISSQRVISGSSGLIYDTYAYFIGSIHLFGVAISNPEMFLLGSDGYLYGTELFNAVISFINNISGMLFGNHKILKSGALIINEVTQQYYHVSPNTYMNNNITMWYGFMRDFGVIGIIVDSLIFAAFYMKLYKSRVKSVYHKLMYLFGFNLIPFTVFEWMHGRTYVLVVFIVLFLLSIYDSKKIII